MSEYFKKIEFIIFFPTVFPICIKPKLQIKVNTKENNIFIPVILAAIPVPILFTDSVNMIFIRFFVLSFPKVVSITCPFSFFKKKYLIVSIIPIAINILAPIRLAIFGVKKYIKNVAHFIDITVIKDVNIAIINFCKKVICIFFIP